MGQCSCDASPPDNRCVEILPFTRQWFSEVIALGGERA